MTLAIHGPNQGRWHLQARIKNCRTTLLPTLLNLLVVAAVTAVISATINPAHLVAVLILYFVPVMLATRLWRLEQGIIAAFASALAATYLFADPIFSFLVSDSSDILALLIFLATSILAACLLDELRSLRRADHDVVAAGPGHVAPENTAKPTLPALNFVAPSRTVPERIAEFLVVAGDEMYCDACIQEKLGLKWRQQVQLVTATLAVTALFRRDNGLCRRCGQLKQVIQFVKAA